MTGVVSRKRRETREIGGLLPNLRIGQSGLCRAVASLDGGTYKNTMRVGAKAQVATLGL